MKTAIEAELQAMKLQNVAHTFTKVIQLYETKNSRHSTMIVGRTQSGKTVSWKVLQAAMTRLNKEGDPSYQAVKVYKIVVNLILRILSSNYVKMI